VEVSSWNGAETVRSTVALEPLSRAEVCPDASEARFTVSVLAEKTGTPVPTIHHYRHLGLLPEVTELASNRFLYDEGHVEALNVIRLLREQRNLPLEAIREMLPELLAFDRQGDFSQETWDEVIVAYLERSGPAVVRHLPSTATPG